jgi:hypothetical protein
MNLTLLENGIAIYDNVLDNNVCNDVIEYFESLRNLNQVYDQTSYAKGPAHVNRKDESIFLTAPHTISLDKTQPVFESFVSAFWQCYEHYTKEYSVLQTAGQHGFYQVRIQKTEPGGGFHNWHFENYDAITCNRVVTWMFYLNDVDEGGETEFLYLNKRIKPRTGRLVIWPASYTHAHRGNPPLTGEKYIITSWLNYF